MKSKPISFVYVLALLLGFQSYIHAQCPTAAVIDQTSIPNATFGVFYSQQMTGSNFSSAITWSIAPNLPGGLAINASGFISGTPIAGSIPSNHTIIATQTVGTCTRTRSIEFKINCPGVTFLASIPNAMASVPYNVAIVSGSNTCSITPALPAGLSFSATGVLFGTPTAISTNPVPTRYTVTAGGSGGCTSGIVFPFSVQCSPGLPAPLPVCYVGVPYSQSLGFAFGTSYSAITPTLPSGLDFNPTTGIISGLLSSYPPSLSLYTVDVFLTPASCNIAGAPLNFSVAICPTASITSAAPATATTSIPYMHTFTANYPNATTFSITPALPAGFTLSSAGELSGNSTIASVSVAYVVRATQTSTGCSSTQAFNFGVICPTITVSSTIPTLNFQIPHGTTISYTFSTTGGTGAISYAITAGALPTGINLSGGGLLNGSTNLTGFGFFTVTATRGGCSGFITYNYWICNPTITIAPATLPTVPVVGVFYSHLPSVGYSSGNTVWSVSPALLPAGLTFNTGTGLIEGTPTSVTASNSYVITATNTTGGFRVCSTTRTYTFAVACPTASITPTTIPTATVNTAYRQQLQTNVTGNVNWSVLPLLPTGITLDNTGLIAGTSMATSVSGSYVVTASNGTCSATRTYPFAVTAVVCPTASITPATIPNATLNTAYNQQLMQTGVTGTVTWSVSPPFPAGTTLDANTGIIASNSTVLRTISNYVVTASNGTCGATASYSFGVICPSASVTTATIPNATLNTAYSQQLMQTGVTGTVTWNVSPAFPTGITLDNTGLISGTSTATSASASYVVTATNGNCSANITYQFAVNDLVSCPALIINPATLANATAGSAYTATLTATGGTAPYTFTVSSGVLPAGLTLTSAGVLAGTPTAAATVTFTVMVTATPVGCIGVSMGMKAYTLVISPNPTTATDNSLANLVKISPNPSNSDFNVDFGSISMAKSVVRVYDAQGKTVFSAENNSNLMIIPLAKFANGIYLMEVETSKGRILKRLAKQ